MTSLKFEFVEVTNVAINFQALSKTASANFCKTCGTVEDIRMIKNTLKELIKYDTKNSNGNIVKLKTGGIYSTYFCWKS